MTDTRNVKLDIPINNGHNLREAMERAEREIKEAARAEKADATRREIAEKTAAEADRRAALPSSRIIEIGDDLRRQIEESRSELRRLESDRDVRVAAVNETKEARTNRNQTSIAFHESEIQRLRADIERDEISAAGAIERIEASSAVEIEALHRIVSATEAMIAGLSKDVSKKGGAK